MRRAWVLSVGRTTGPLTNDQPTPGEIPTAPKDKSELKRDEGENTISSNQEDPRNQDFHKAKSE